MRNILLTIFTVLVLAGCAGTHHTTGVSVTKNEMDSWLGHPVAELIRAWGPPQSYAWDGSDGAILIYRSTETYGGFEFGQYHERTIHPSKMFYADANGTIYYWRTGQ